MIRISRRPLLVLFVEAAALAGAVILSGTFLRKLAARPRPAAGSAEALLRNFSGVNNMISAGAATELGVGWTRIPFDWRGIEPRKGDWRWDGTDAAIQQAHRSGMEMLPDISFTAAWAAQPAHPGFQPSFGPPANVADWEDFVERLVSRYSAEPYNLRYFQIWNEPGGPFFQGTDQQFADLVYIPAAKIVRSHHGIVVFGGLADTVNLQRFNSLMNYHELWRLTDIVDVHYKGFGEFQQFYSAWVANGKCRGMWQTEVGWTPQPGFLGDLYSRTLHWTLEMGWRSPDEFKYIWFAGQGNGPQGNRCLVNLSLPAGKQYTDAGTRLEVMNQALGSGPLSTYSEFSTEPPNGGLASNGWALGYHVGSNRVVIGFLMNRAVARTYDSVRVNLQLPTKPSRVQLLSGLGKSWDLPPNFSGGHAQITVPLRQGFDDCTACSTVQGYLVADE